MKNDKVRDIWNTNAEFWDGRMGEGNDFHRILIEPVQLKLLNIQTGHRVLDLACGNGQFARKISSLGAEVTAVDFSDKFIQIALAKSGSNIKYQVIDLTSENDLEKLAGFGYDAAVCTMAIMDVSDIGPLIKYLPKIIKNKGIFVFSICHPCFNSGDFSLVHETDDHGGEVKNRYYVKVRDYLIEGSRQGVGMIGQPQPQYYFHRPVAAILNLCFQHGFVLDAYEEPSFKDIHPKNIFDNVYKNVPPALICRLRLI